MAVSGPDHLGSLMYSCALAFPLSEMRHQCRVLSRKSDTLKNHLAAGFTLDCGQASEKTLAREF